VQTPSTIEATGTYCIDDLARSTFLGVLGRSRAFPWVVGITLVLFVAFVAFETARGDEVGSTAPILLLAVIFLYLLSMMTYRNCRKELAARKHFRDPIAYLFTHETISTVGTGLSSATGWGNIVRIRETRSLFLLYLGLSGAVIVPKRFFKSTREIENWRQLVASSVNPKLIEKPGFFGRWC
jgi:YcxB-like protein